MRPTAQASRPYEVNLQPNRCLRRRRRRRGRPTWLTVVLFLSSSSTPRLFVGCFAAVAVPRGSQRQHRQRRQQRQAQPVSLPLATGFAKVARQGRHRRHKRLSVSDAEGDSVCGFRGGSSNGNSSSTTTSTSTSTSGTGTTGIAVPQAVGIWPCFDPLDFRLIKISLPVIANFAINPLIGAVDLFWVNRMGNALAVAGQAAANQVFSSAFWVTSFLPAVTATLISKENAAGNREGVREAVCQALFLSIVMAIAGTALLVRNPSAVLKSVLPAGAPALPYAKPYLAIRSFAFLPSLISLVGFSAFRGILETLTPVKVSSFANVFNAALDPILIFTLAMGVPGAALATLAAEIISAGLYLYLLRKRDMIRIREIIKPPSWTRLEPLLRGGAALQLRNVALNLTFIMVARVTQGIDQSGVAAAAHAMALQVFQVGGIVLLALSTVAQTVVPNDLVERYEEVEVEVVPEVAEEASTAGGPNDNRDGDGTAGGSIGIEEQQLPPPQQEQEQQQEQQQQQRVVQRRIAVGGRRVAKTTVNRLMGWGLVLGIVLGSMQIALIPALQRSTPLQEVRDAARVPSLLASVLQIINGLVFIGEGVMVGCGSYLQLSLQTSAATAACLWALLTLPDRYGLTGVWLGFAVFNSVRLAGVFLHQFINGPLAPRNLDQRELEPGIVELPDCGTPSDGRV